MRGRMSRSRGGGRNSRRPQHQPPPVEPCCRAGRTAQAGGGAASPARPTVSIWNTCGCWTRPSSAPRAAASCSTTASRAAAAATGARTTTTTTARRRCPPRRRGGCTRRCPSAYLATARHPRQPARRRAARSRASRCWITATKRRSSCSSTPGPSCWERPRASPRRLRASRPSARPSSSACAVTALSPTIPACEWRAAGGASRSSRRWSGTCTTPPRARSWARPPPSATGRRSPSLGSEHGEDGWLARTA
mmetsp:Transcript_2615/g.9490  ORF Transcript_2615/g.9490 Transcript_2615/m.9490 type:complete len:250 (+) Transcript_2615:535-1284(+)